jgi:membrane-bound lytic murein transglycosylase B
MLALILVCIASFTLILPAKAQDLQSWLATLIKEANDQGISKATTDSYLSDFQPIKRVIELQNKQPESTKTFDQYLNSFLEKRTRVGRQKMQEHRVLLDEISKKYQVEPQYIVALWGLESSFGNYMGNTPTVAALATLAYQGRRRDYFRRELIEVLRIADQGHIDADNLKGSWAGAMGQCQFMPSSFKDLAVDYDGDGRRDIWTNRGDVFASIANYLSRSGWKKGQLWGRPALIPAEVDPRLVDKGVKMRLSQWRVFGVQKADGSALPRRPNLWASLIRADGDRGRTFVVYDNYHVFLRWNNSNFFALSAGLLANRLAE